jgi:hypothetical protein
MLRRLEARVQDQIRGIPVRVPVVVEQQQAKASRLDRLLSEDSSKAFSRANRGAAATTTS